jgi:hypothetical protein
VTAPATGGTPVPDSSNTTTTGPAPKQDPDCKPGTGPGQPDPQCEPVSGPDSQDEG